MSLDVSAPELAFALDAVREAALVTQRIQHSMNVEGIQKSDFSPVTIADYSAQALVARKMAAAFPDAVLVGEEDAADLRGAEAEATVAQITQFVQEHEPSATPEQVCDWIDRGNGDPNERFWTLDPIDGTKGYLRKEQYAIAFGLIENGKVVLGVLGCPNLSSECSPDGAAEGVVLAAVRGQGTWCGSLEGGNDFRQLKVSSCDDVSQARMLRSVEAGHTNVDQISQLSQALGMKADPVCLDSQAKYAVLGSGGGEVLVRLLSPKMPDYKEKIWDQAAGSIVVEEAGGTITDLSGTPLDFGQGRTLAKNSGVCATNGILHEETIAAMSRL